jgi:predicted esterase
MKKINIKTTKTARYFILGNLSDSTEEVLIVLHGYAQLAHYFIKKFNFLSNKKRVILAPEGLSKFYWQGMNGRVVASWMTKEDRQNEIKDQITYLDKIYLTIKKKSPEATITVLGFSQGTATLCRWLAASEYKVQRILLWAGGIPEEVMESPFIQHTHFEIIIGDQDEFIPKEHIEIMEKSFNENGISFDLTLFEGKHSIDSDVLKHLFS